MKTAPEGTTHVLSWLPDRLAPARAGYWEFRTLAAFRARQRPDHADWILGAPRWGASDDLAAWASRTLGVPVVLHPGSRRIPVGQWRKSEPLFWMVPGGAS